jgi:hypothetical protein
MSDYTKILNIKYPGSQWTLNGDDYDGLTWLSDTPKPTKKKLDDLWAEVQAEILATEESKKSAKAALLDRLGITAEEAQLLLS